MCQERTFLTASGIAKAGPMPITEGSTPTAAKLLCCKKSKARLVSKKIYFPRNKKKKKTRRGGGSWLPENTENGKTAFLGKCAACDQACRGAVAHLTGISGSCGTALSEDGSEFGELLDGGVLAHALILAHSDGLAVLSLNGNGHDFILELAALDSSGSPLVGELCQGILLESMNRMIVA